MNNHHLEIWADQLLEEYEDGRGELSSMVNNLDPVSDVDNLDKSHINSMIDSMTFSIDWMETGRQPGLYRGADKKNAYRVKQYDEMDVIPDITEQMEREPLYMGNDQRRILLQLFRNFSERERECYILYEAEQLSMQKIADRLGVSKGTVQNYLKRAKEKVNAIAS